MNDSDSAISTPAWTFTRYNISARHYDASRSDNTLNVHVMYDSHNSGGAYTVGDIRNVKNVEARHSDAERSINLSRTDSQLLTIQRRRIAQRLCATLRVMQCHRNIAACQSRSHGIKSYLRSFTAGRTVYNRDARDGSIKIKITQTLHLHCSRPK